MKLSFRIIVNRYEKEEQFQQLLDFLLEYKDSIDELALFTEYWHHGYYPLDSFSERCRILENRIERLHLFGFKNVGINMLNTLGHLPEAWDWLPELPYQALMSPDGEISKSSFCPNSAAFQTYIFRKYTLAAQAKPDFIWVDDDIRMHLRDIAFACFCPECLRIYNNAYKTELTREELVSELNSSEGKIHRQRWVQQNNNTIQRLLARIAKAIHCVDNRIEIGLMTLGFGLTIYKGVDFTKWFTALEAVKARPGHGFYDDGQPFGFVRKIHEVNRQIAHYPDFVKDIQYELENFPFQKLNKSIHITLLECTASIMAGTHGIAFDALKQEEGTLEEYHELMRSIHGSKPLWTAMDNIAGTFRSGGLFPALSASFEARRGVKNNKWLEIPPDDNCLKSYVLSEIGIPLTMNGDAACGTILTGNIPEGYSKKELKEMLRQGVLLDGRALEILSEKGLGAYCGVSVEKTYDNGVYECLTDDPLNSGYQGEQRDARNLKKGLSYCLKPLQDNVRVLSRLISFTKADLGPASSVYENTLGGRVAVQGYLPWQNIYSAVKRTQLIQICDWLSYGRLPVVIDKCIKVVPFIKYSDDGGSWFVMLLNASFDETGTFVAKIRNSADSGPVFELLADGSSIQLTDSAYRKNDGEIILSIDNIGSWKSRMFYQGI